MAVNQPWYGTETAAVDLLELPVGFPKGRTKLTHRTEGGDSPVLAQDVCVVHDLDGRERVTPKRRLAAGRRRQLSEVPHEQAPPALPVAHSADWGGIGGSIPCSAANAIASG